MTVIEELYREMCARRDMDLERTRRNPHLAPKPFEVWDEAIALVEGIVKEEKRAEGDRRTMERILNQ